MSDDPLIKQFSAILAARVGSISKKGLDQVVADIKRAVDFGERGRELADPVKTKFAAIDKTAASNRRFCELSRTIDGVRLVWKEVSNLYAILESKIADLRGEFPLPVTRDRYEPGNFIMVYGPEVSGPTPQIRKKLTLRFDIRKVYGNSVADAALERRVYFEETDFADRYQGMGLITERSYSPFFPESNLVVWKDSNRSTFNSGEVITEALLSFAGSIKDIVEERQITWRHIQA